MSCQCENVDKFTIINFICDEIEDLDLDNKWESYLGFIDERFKTASIRWSLTKPDTRIWFSRVLRNMSKEELIFWGHKECFCIDQMEKTCINYKL